MATDSVRRPGELKEILLKEIQAADLAEIDVRDVGTALEVKDGIARIYGLTSAMAGEMLEFTSSETGEKVTGQALNLRSEEHTSELQSQSNLVCRLLLEKKKKQTDDSPRHAVQVSYIADRCRTASLT